MPTAFSLIPSCQINFILYLSFLKHRRINTSKKILVAPLNWGLGHATRCIPIINALIENGFEPIIASDGNALKLLQLEFPNIKNWELPSYNIQYSNKGKWLKWKLLWQLPHFFKTMKAEHRLTQEIIQNENIAGIISDNRFGVWNKSVPSVYITHQLTVLSGFTTFLTTFFHRLVINKFDECWIPDSSSHALSGKLSIVTNLKILIKYMGAISRMKYQSLPKKYDVCVVLSGLEPQRTILEEILLKEFYQFNGSICFVRGIISENEIIENRSNFTFHNYLTAKELNKVINQSDIIIARSGYSTILDLARLGKKAFFIPTPGQTEQEYLAHHLQQQQMAPYCEQSKFTIKKMEEVVNYTGFNKQENTLNPDLFNIF